jgi:hypothetical protein
MFLLGLLSIIQIVFLPGYLAARALRMAEDGAIKTWILSFTLSLVINHLLVFALVIFHAYNRVSLYSIFGLELLLLAWMQYAALGMPSASLFAKDRQRISDLRTQMNQSEAPARWIGNVVIFSAVSTLFIYLQRFTTSGHIFTAWDSVVSWNRWAVEWHNNDFPTWIFQYPQLLPTNMSITYMFMGNATVQLFAKMIMPLFPLTILLAVTDLGLRLKNLALIFSITTTGALLLWLAGDLVDSGLADIPMACIAFSAVYMLLLSTNAASETETRKYLLIGAVFCAGASLTKQPGICLAAAYPVLSFLLVPEQQNGSGITARAKTAALLYGTSAVLIAPWYLFIWITGMGMNNLSYLASESVHQGRSWLERLSFAMNLVEGGLGRILTYWIIPLALFFGAYHRTWRWLLIAVVVPWFFAWAMLFSYDIRNLALAIPFVGVIIGVGLYDLCRMYVEKVAMAIVRAEWKVIALALLIASLILSFVYPSERLVRHQVELQKRMGYERVNNALYEYQKTNGFKGKIATRYQLLGFLPGLKEYYSQLEVSGVTLEQFLHSVEDVNPGYFLWQRSQTDPRIDRFVRDKINSRDYAVIFDVDGYELIELRDRHIGNSARVRN